VDSILALDRWFAREIDAASEQQLNRLLVLKLTLKREMAAAPLRRARVVAAAFLTSRRQTGGGHA